MNIINPETRLIIATILNADVIDRVKNIKISVSFKFIIISYETSLIIFT